MHLSTAILGSNIVEKLQERQTSAVLTIGSDKFTRPQLSRIGCFNFLAAARLSHLLTDELKVQNTADLFRNFPPSHLALPGLGAICLATVGAAFEVKGLGTLADYINKHQAKGATMVTFATMKHNLLDVKATRAENKAIKNRKQSRTNRATKLRGDRHIERSTRHLSVAS